MVVIAILGIMSATAIPLYRTIQQRSYGSEAALMAKQITDAQIVYFLEHDKFFPGEDQTIEIFHSDPPSKEEIRRVKEALGITISVGHFLDYYFGPSHGPGGEGFHLTITAARQFPFFNGRAAPGMVVATVTRDGNVDIQYP
jgi:type II secretory pathway pseudopilin PulG